ncbi:MULTISPECIES: hypothetical protein [unclassified Streptomyces]|uniref:hypothetical protein n=1 Tax=unclassified Streptomyces TaxID=2593676 RepID=UPI003CFE7C68
MSILQPAPRRPGGILLGTPPFPRAEEGVSPTGPRAGLDGQREPAPVTGGALPRPVGRDRKRYAGGGMAVSSGNAVSAVVTGAAAVAGTGCAAAVAGHGRGRRRITLVPGVVRTAGRLAAPVPWALARLDAHRRRTWVSGPSATSGIGPERAEGVHEPRRLHVPLGGK